MAELTETGDEQAQVPAQAEPIDWHVAQVVGAARYTWAGRLLKRLIDVVASSILLVVLTPVFALIALMIRLDSPGPAVFRQSRVGFHERPFTIWKFRTMTVDNDDVEHRRYVTAMLRGEAEPDQPLLDARGEAVYKLVGDTRITRVGSMLRRTSLDELPQLVNVLEGSMSLVGPRPSLDYEVAEYSARQRLRATAVPGMTGLWQVEGRNSMTMNEALDLDLRYVESCHLLLDLRILVRTARVMVSSRGH